MLQVTAVFVAPVKLAVNWRVCPTPSVTVAGLTVRLTDERVMTAIPDFVGSPTLVAVTITDCGFASAPPAAVKRPDASIVPALDGFTDQVTLVLASPVTVAVNCWVPTCPRVTAKGETLMITGGGVKVTVAVANLVESPTLVAVTVTDCCVVTTAGAE